MLILCDHCGKFLNMCNEAQALLGSRALLQEFLDLLLFFQEECPDDPLLDTRSTSAATVSPGYSPLAFLEVAVGTVLEMLDTGKRCLAVGASWTFCCFNNSLGDKLSTRGADGACTTGTGVVGVAAYSGNT